VIDAIEKMGELENTLVILIWGDSGASMEGTLTGSFNAWTMINGLPLTGEQQPALAHDVGNAREALGRALARTRRLNAPRRSGSSVSPTPGPGNAAGAGTRRESPALFRAPHGSVLLTCARLHLQEHGRFRVAGMWMHSWGSRGRRFKLMSVGLRA